MSRHRLLLGTGVVGNGAGTSRIGTSRLKTARLKRHTVYMTLGGASLTELFNEAFLTAARA